MKVLMSYQKCATQKSARYRPRLKEPKEARAEAERADGGIASDHGLSKKPRPEEAPLGGDKPLEWQPLAYDDPFERVAPS